MLVEFDNIKAKVREGTVDERDWLRQYLTFPDPQGRFRPGNRTEYSVFNLFSGSFPTGLCPLVQRKAKEAGVSLRMVDRRDRPTWEWGQENETSLAQLGLRDYQSAAVAKGLARTRGIIKSPTGSGKGNMIVGFTVAAPIRWAFIVHRNHLIRQQALRYEQLTGRRAGKIAEGEWEVPDDCNFVCISFPALTQMLKRNDPRLQRFLPTVLGLLIDECHTLPAATFRAAVEAFDAAYYRIGLSGTPLDRSDRRAVHAIGSLGPVIFEVAASTLVEEGILAKPSITMVKVPTKPIEAKTWAGVYTAGITKGTKRNAAIIQATVDAEKPCMLFVQHIKHGKELERTLLKRGMAARFVFGSSSGDDRERHIRDLAAGRIDVLVSSVVLAEGVDIPDLRSVVVGSGGKSIIQVLQRLGRGMRVTKDKTTFEVIDFIDVPADENGSLLKVNPELSFGQRLLYKHSLARRRAYLREKHDVTERMFIG